METITECRSCRSKRLDAVLDLGEQPLADRLLTEADLTQAEPRFPLNVVFCNDCGLMQIRETVEPEVLFCDAYPYYSSFSDALLKHSADNVNEIIRERQLGSDSFVVEIASNDGYLLKNYVAQGIPVLGIDPASGPAEQAQRVGVDTLVDFFDTALAMRLAAEGRQADVIHGNNVLAHVADTNGFVSALATLVKDTGVIVIEVPYVRHLIEKTEFDTIYHEHLCYFSVTALDHLFRRHGLYLNRLRHLSIHGGSLRLFVEKHENVDATVREALDAERRDGLDRLDYYADFSDRVAKLRSELLTLLNEAKRDGKTIAAYGAAAKGATLINFVGIGTDLIDFVVDRNTHKQHHFMPGQHLPISPTERLLDDRPDLVLILAWNFADEIRKQQADYVARGGRFIIPVPEPIVV